MQSTATFSLLVHRTRILCLLETGTRIQKLLTLRKMYKQSYDSFNFYHFFNDKSLAIMKILQQEELFRSVLRVFGGQIFETFLSWKIFNTYKVKKQNKTQFNDLPCIHPFSFNN